MKRSSGSTCMLRMRVFVAAAAEREGVERLARRDVDDLDLFERRVEHVELLLV